MHQSLKLYMIVKPQKMLNLSTFYGSYTFSNFSLTLKTALADISAATNTCKQSAVTFEVFLLLLRNQHYNARDVIGIKMMYRDLPYYEGISPKHTMNIKQAQKSRKLFTYF